MLSGLGTADEIEGNRKRLQAACGPDGADTTGAAISIDGGRSAL